MIKIAFIGCGGMGRTHLRRLLPRADVAIVGISDRSRQSLELARELVMEIVPGKLDKITFSENAKEMILNIAADAAVVPLPSNLHKEYAIAALNAGKHVFCEKPMALTAADAEAMLAARDRAGKIIMIGQSLRFNRIYRQLRKMARDGTYGGIVRAHFYRVGGLLGMTPKPWFLDARQSGGALMDLHIHDADFILSLLGRPSAVEAFGAANMLNNNSGPDQMMIHYLYRDSKVFVTSEAGWLRIADTRFDEGFEVDFEKAIAISENGRLRYDLPGDWKKPAKYVETEPDDMPADMWSYFLECVGKGVQPVFCPPKESCFAVRMANAAAKAIETKKTVSLE